MKLIHKFSEWWEAHGFLAIDTTKAEKIAADRHWFDQIKPVPGWRVSRLVVVVLPPTIFRPWRRTVVLRREYGVQR